MRRNDEIADWARTDTSARRRDPERGTQGEEGKRVRSKAQNRDTEGNGETASKRLERINNIHGSGAVWAVRKGDNRKILS